MNTGKLNKLRDLQGRLGSILSSKSIGEKYLGQLAFLDQVDDCYNLLNLKINLLKNMEKTNSNYIGLIAELRKIKSDLSSNIHTSKDLTLRYRDLLLKQETCPLCHSSIDMDKVHNIISHYDFEKKGEL